jgi:hypothetical protein
MILGPPQASALTRFRRAGLPIGLRRWATDYVPAGTRELPDWLTEAMFQPGSARDLANAQRSAAGWVTTRDRLHGRVVDRRSVVEMAPPHSLDTVVNGRDSAAGSRPPPGTKMLTLVTWGKTRGPA